MRLRPRASVTLSDIAEKLAQSIGESTTRPSNDGKTSPAEMALNPSFVEWMMGAPDGWSDPDCPLSATEFSSKQDGYADNES